MNLKSRNLLFLGIVLLWIGIAMRIFTAQNYIALAIILSGVVCKFFYILNFIKNKGYKAGVEFTILTIGLLLFIVGLILRKGECSINYRYYMYSGITLKATFIVLFIIKSKRLKGSRQ